MPCQRVYISQLTALSMSLLAAEYAPDPGYLSAACQTLSQLSRSSIRGGYEPAAMVYRLVNAMNAPPPPLLACDDILFVVGNRGDSAVHPPLCRMLLTRASRCNAGCCVSAIDGCNQRGLWVNRLSYPGHQVVHRLSAPCPRCLNRVAFGAWRPYNSGRSANTGP